MELVCRGSMDLWSKAIASPTFSPSSTMAGERVLHAGDGRRRPVTIGTWPTSQRPWVKLVFTEMTSVHFDLDGIQDLWEREYVHGQRKRKLQSQ